jgi:hypothetical protein
MAAFSRNPAGRTLPTIPNHAVIASEARTASSLSAFCEENLSSLSALPMSRVWDARRFSPRRRFGPRNQSLIVPILFQITVQSGPPDSQRLRRPQSISFAHRQHSLNVLLSHFFQGQGPPIIPAAGPSPAVLQMAARLAWGSGDISRTRHCTSFVVSNGSA